jgi:hypothetical protein
LCWLFALTVIIGPAALIEKAPGRACGTLAARVIDGIDFMCCVKFNRLDRKRVLGCMR